MNRCALVTSALILGASVCLPVGRVHAEPYLAVESGLQCRSCHTNPTGGGKRTLFGMTYARTNLAVQTLFSGESTQAWNSQINRYLGVGGDYRGGFRQTDVPGQTSRSDWETSKATVYLEINPIPGLLTIYADEQVAPGGSLNREAYLMLTPRQGKFTIKAGQMFLPFGLRLQDDSAFVRQRSGINFDTPDDGIEFGLELPKWSAQAAFSNGTAGAGSQSGKDQMSLSATYFVSRWRIGASVNQNNDPLGDRNMLGVFAGFRTGPISWLAEVDFIEDKVPNGRDNEIMATIVEGNWRIRKGHNLKVSYDFVDPSDGGSEDELERYSILWEYSPIQLLQTRVGFRAYNGVPTQPSTNRDEIFLEAHVFF